MTLGWCVENRDISALYGNSQNKLLSVLGPLCVLHQPLTLALAHGVLLLPVFSTPSTLAEMPSLSLTGTDLRAWQWGGRQEGGEGTEIPACAVAVPPSQLPSHIICFLSAPYLDKKGCGSAG